jgi:hypothetical protein
MHSANFTAFSRAVAFLFPPVPVLLTVVPTGAVVLVPPLLPVPPQPALMTATMATTARAADRPSFLVMVSPFAC